MDKLSNTHKVLILLGALILGGVVGYFWDNISQLWSDKTPVLDENGKPTGRYAPSSVNGSARAMRNCCSWGGGFIGKGCNYPITKKDTVSPCTLL